ncbi:MAG: DMT family transporter [Nevskiales bacterium]|nr:DMT family transporter [Nevskiales bacterium]
MRNNLTRGALHAFAAAAAFSLMGACIKTASRHAPNEVIVFVRCAVSLIILFPWLARKGGLGVRTRRLGGHLWRAGFGILAMYAFFYAIAHLPLAEAMLLTYSTPLWIPFIAWFWIGERPPAVVYPSAALGMVGVAFIVKPGLHAISPVAGMVGLASGILAACAMVSIRRITDTEPPARIVFYFALLGTAISAIPLVWAWQMPDLPTLALLLGAGLLATAGQMQLTRAYSCAPAALIGPFTYVAVPISGALAWLVWDERPDRWSLLGAALVIASCVLVGVRSRQTPSPARSGR